MKRLVVYIVLGFIFVSGFSQEEVNWLGIEEAEKLAKQKPKPLFVDVYTTWCGWCKRMDRDTFDNPVIAKILNEKFYPVKFNAESSKAVTFKGNSYKNINAEKGYRGKHQLTNELLRKARGYPSFALYTLNLEHYHVLQGYLKPAQIEPILEYVGDNLYMTTKYEDFLKKFKTRL